MPIMFQYDFANEADKEKYPAHGWATNSQGLKLLWLPAIDRLSTHRYSYFQGQLLVPGEGWDLPDCEPLLQTVRRLVVVLRELHSLHRRVSDSVTFDDQPKRDDQASCHAEEFAPPLVDLAFIYLRRLPDLLVRSVAHRILGAWKSAPLDFKKWIADPNSLLKLKPLCDGDALKNAILEAEPWFSRLRGRSADGRLGIRDSLEHRPMRIDAGPSKLGDSPTRLKVMITGEASDSGAVFDALAEIRTYIAGLARLLTSMTAILPGTGSYTRRASVMVTGSLDDTVGFWPQL